MGEGAPMGIVSGASLPYPYHGSSGIPDQLHGAMGNRSSRTQQQAAHRSNRKIVRSDLCLNEYSAVVAADPAPLQIDERYAVCYPGQFWDPGLFGSNNLMSL